jgi:hypothetical protein
MLSISLRASERCIAFMLRGMHWLRFEMVDAVVVIVLRHVMLLVPEREYI